jgi:tetratricopeptide (TPR) repeat protein
MKQGIVVLAALLFVGRAASGQSAAEHVAMGDRDHAALNLVSAVKHYEAALAADPRHFDALVKAAHDAVDLGEFDPSEQQRDTLYRKAEDYARRAIAVNPNDTEGHFELARAIGRRALTMGKRDQVKFAGVVHDEAMQVLKVNPKHAGAMHVMGVWNEHIMQLNGLTRMIAKNLLGGKVFGEANWDNARKYLEDAVALEPTRITHRLDLGRVYQDRDDKVKAREQFEWIVKAPITDFNDSHYKQEAERALRDLR